MREQKTVPLEIAAFYHILTEKWFVDGWSYSLQYVNDEFKDGWVINVFLPGSERDPEIVNIPADGSVPHFMIAKCCYAFESGIKNGRNNAAEIIVSKLMAQTATSVLDVIHRGVDAFAVTSHLKQFTKDHNIRAAATLLYKDQQDG